jgi:predicted Zn-dependent protease
MRSNPPKAARRHAAPLSVLLLALMAASLTGCAVNPVTGQREFVLFTEGQEIQMGEQADLEIRGSLGEYDDPALQAWLDEMGQAMAAESERPHLPWTFRILDDPTVNAFALPGGYIYITRGIMAHLSSDAELAGIVGHEIGHVTARHGITRVSRAQAAQLGLGVGMILAPDFRPFGEALGVGLQLLFLSNSREAEREADDLGLRYMATQDYDPRAVARVFEMLARASGAEDGDRIPGFLSTHPDPLNRRDRILAQTTGDDPVARGTRDERDAYLQRLDGLVFGDDPRQGFFRENAFLHPDMAFRLDFPPGWRTANLRSEVHGMGPEEDAAMVLTIVDAATPAAGRQAFLGTEGVEALATSDESVGGLPAAWADFRVRTESGTFRGRALFVRHGDLTFRVLGYAPEDRWSARQDAVARSLRTFQRVTDRRILDVQPRRVELVRTQTDLTLEGFHQRHPSTVPVETIGVINGVRPGEVIPAGTLVKRVVGEGADGVAVDAGGG